MKHHEGKQSHDEVTEASQNQEVGQQEATSEQNDVEATTDKHEDQGTEKAGDAPHEVPDDAKVETHESEEPDDQQHETSEASIETPAAVVVGGHVGRWHRLLGFFGRHKVWSSVFGVVIVLALLAAVPWTRYKIAGLFLKQTVTVVVVDSQTNAPVTAAEVSLAGASAKTDNHGNVKLRVRVGSSKVTIYKTYYESKAITTTVPILRPKHNVSVSLVSTGRQVPIVVTNKITGKALENATVKAAGGEAKTDAKGQATIVLPPNKATVAATISADGYNDATATIQVTTSSVAGNTFALTPSGKIYFLSNLSGKIDVVKTNLDGTGRQTVLAGTGFENAQSTSLLASRDWKYLALGSVRTSGASAQLNLIDTTNGDKITNIDQGTNVTFSPVGWDGNYFIYTVTRQNVQSWQSGQSAIKSYNAQTGKITVLDQTVGSGTSVYDTLHSFFGTIYILDNAVVYGTNWQGGYYESAQTSAKQATLNSVQPDGSNKKVIKSFAATIPTTYVSFNTIPYEANGLYIAFSPDSDFDFYTYEDGAVKPNTTLTRDNFYNTPYATYLLSPSGNQNFWSANADGKNNLLVGDENGDNGKQIATLSDYNVYGWYTDNYLLVSKNSSELYVMPVAGGTPLKISDYYKPAQNFSGYGKGYGGL